MRESALSTATVEFQGWTVTLLIATLEVGPACFPGAAVADAGSSYAHTCFKGALAGTEPRIA